jgi:hypothetical protein
MKRALFSSRNLLTGLFLAAFLVGCERVRSLSPGNSEHVIAFPAISGPAPGVANPYPEPAGDLAPYYGTPPLAVLTVGEQSQTAALTGACWMQIGSDGTAGEACLDSTGILTPQGFLPSEVQFNGKLHLNLPLTPTAVSAYWIPVTPADVMEPPSEGTIRWPSREGRSINLANEIEQDLQLELDPGLNVIHIYAQWEGLGSAGYGFLVEARVP